MSAKTAAIRLKRAYALPAKADGQRVLVDRVWPRGVSKDDLKLDDWVKEVAPSSELRKWFGHDPEKWEGFKERYFAELEDCPQAVDRLRERLARGTVTLVFGAKDTEHNNAVALKAYLQRRR